MCVCVCVCVCVRRGLTKELEEVEDSARSAETDPTEELLIRSPCGISFLRREVLIYDSMF